MKTHQQTWKHKAIITLRVLPQNDQDKRETLPIIQSPTMNKRYPPAISKLIRAHQLKNSSQALPHSMPPPLTSRTKQISLSMRKMALLNPSPARLITAQHALAHIERSPAGRRESCSLRCCVRVRALWPFAAVAAPDAEGLMGRRGGAVVLWWVW